MVAADAAGGSGGWAVRFQRRICRRSDSRLPSSARTSAGAAKITVARTCAGQVPTCCIDSFIRARSFIAATELSLPGCVCACHCLVGIVQLHSHNQRVTVIFHRRNYGSCAEICKQIENRD